MAAFAYGSLMEWPRCLIQNTETRCIDQLTIADLVSLYVKVSQIEREPVVANDIKRAAARLSAKDPEALKFHSQDTGHMESILKMN